MNRCTRDLIASELLQEQHQVRLRSKLNSEAISWWNKALETLI